ncbi:MAG: MoaD/ThiS family protein [Alphaproteobacteria bacterium]|nr:MoaD/ThiS family protein [Alphaproteobacteria bacterium]
MPRVSFTANLQRHVATPTLDVEATTVRGALDAVFAAHPRLRGYILDDQGEIRRHVAIYRNGAQAARAALDDEVGRQDEIYVFQALSGG